MRFKSPWEKAPIVKLKPQVETFLSIIKSLDADHFSRFEISIQLEQSSRDETVMYRAVRARHGEHYDIDLDKSRVSALRDFFSEELQIETVPLRWLKYAYMFKGEAH